ncbi:shikimate kinase [Streptomyces sp. Ru71]|nr:shikimate kinase [Streptomyces sp. Ru71]
MNAPYAVLIGLPGSGKSTVGRALSARVGVSFRDTDEDVEQTTGRSIADLFAWEGERRFRELEREAVAAALAEHRGVLALGGGAVLDPLTRARLAGRNVVHLRADPAQLADRLRGDTTRPLLTGAGQGRLNELARTRTPLYERLARVSVATAGRTPDAVADAVVRSLGSLGPGVGRAQGLGVQTRAAVGAHVQGEQHRGHDDRGDHMAQE